MQYSVIQYNTTQYNTTQYNMMQYKTVQSNAMQHSAVHHNAISFYSHVFFYFINQVPGSEGAANGPLYTVNMDGIIRTLRHRTLHSIAVDRFGNLSARVIELLQRKK